MTIKKHVLPYFLILIPIVGLFYFIQQMGLNIPFWDDHALKATVLDFENATSWSDKILVLFKQHNEHRISLTRLLAVASFKLLGTINFQYLQYFGNFLWLGVGLIFYKVGTKSTLNIWHFVPISFLFFGLQFHENTFWGMSAVQNFGIIFWILWSIYLVSFHLDKLFWLAIVTSIFAVFTSGNGIFVIPIITMLLLLKKEFKKMFVYLCFGIGIIGIYFYQFEFPPTKQTNFEIPIIALIKFTFAFIGQWADIFSEMDINNRFQISMYFGILLGIATMFICILSLKKIFFNTHNKAKNIDFFTLGTIAFVFLTALVVVYKRIDYGQATILTSRYKMYSLVLMTIIYVYLLHYIPRLKTNFLAFLLSCASIMIAIIIVLESLPQIQWHKNLLLTSQANDWANNTYPPAKLEVYQKPFNVFYKPDVKYGLNKQELFIKNVNDNQISVESKDFVTDNSWKNNCFLQLKSTKNTYYFPVYRNRNKSKKSFLTTFSYYEKGIKCLLSKDEISTGIYQVNLGFTQNNTLNIIPTNIGELEIIQTAAQKIDKNW
ncbi:MAG: hypothetical protein KA313_06730 [Pseudarcicella sp.]|nr:hypothetical protein [Pseudarcicella sp.]